MDYKINCRGWSRASRILRFRVLSGPWHAALKISSIGESTRIKGIAAGPLKASPALMSTAAGHSSVGRGRAPRRPRRLDHRTIHVFQPFADHVGADEVAFLGRKLVRDPLLQVRRLGGEK